MTFCAVPGCNSTANDSSANYTFHLVPSSLILRAQWVLALGPLRDNTYVCSRHFDDSMFTGCGNMKRLVPNAVPIRVMDTQLNKGSSINPRECFEEESGGESSEELVACRACLAADGRLYAISGSGLEDALATITGVELSARGFPRHLCVYCLSRLSKCAAFRASCRRSDALLRTLMEKGTLQMNHVKSIDRNTHKLTNNLAVYKVFEFSTDVFLAAPPEIKTENDEIQHEATAFVAVEWKGRKDSVKKDVDPQSFEVPVEKHEAEVKLVKLKTENANVHSDNDYFESEVKNDTSDNDTDTSDETLAAVKRGKRKRAKAEKENTVKNAKKCKRKSVKSKLSKAAKVVDDDDKVEAPKKTRRLRKTVGVKTDTETAFEKKFNCKTRLLSKEEQKQEVEERKRNNKSAYSCELCGKGFKKENTLMTHKSYHDPSLPAECDVCRLRFRSRRSLLKHQDCHRATFTCNECGNVSRNRSHAKDHCLMHKGATYTCPYCQIVYNHQTSYYNHVRVQHPGQNEACDECGETFAAGRGMMLHKALTHKQNIKPNVDTKCTLCDVKFLNAEALRRHSELSAGVPHAGLWPCAACGDSCGSERALAAHAAEQHPPEQRYCQECNKTFSNAASFALHVDRKHKNQRAVEAPFRPRPGIGRVRSTVCEICGKVYQNLTMLQYHMNGHLSVKPFQCPHCPKAFTHQSNHRLHMRVHTGERPYQCEQCPLAFSRRGNFTKHMKNVHLRVQVKCDTCGKMVGAGSLASHVRAVHLRQPYVRRKRNRNAEKLLLGTQT